MCHMLENITVTVMSQHDDEIKVDCRGNPCNKHVNDTQTSVFSGQKRAAGLISPTNRQL